MFRLPGGTDNPEHVETLRRPMCDGSHEGRWGPQCRQRRVQARVDAENPVEAGDLEDAQDPGSGGDDVERPAAHAHVLELADQSVHPLGKLLGTALHDLGELTDDGPLPSQEGIGVGADERFDAPHPGPDRGLTEQGHQTAVRAGENAGKTLSHDYVVRRLIGPLRPDPAGRLSLRQKIALEADWKRAALGVAVFVQDKATGEVVQALQRHACPG